MKILSRLKLPENNYSVTATGAQNFLGYDDAQSIENPRINNHIFTAPSAHNFLA